jgi:hypothetical protein
MKPVHLSGKIEESVGLGLTPRNDEYRIFPVGAQKGPGETEARP